MDETLAAAAVVSMHEVNADSEIAVLNATAGKAPVTDVLQPVNGNQGACSNPDPPPLFPSTPRGASSLHEIPQHLTSFGSGRDRR